MEKDFEKETSADRLGKFILKNRKVIVSAVCVVAVLSVGYGVSSVVMEKNAAAGLAKVDAISFQLTQDLIKHCHSCSRLFLRKVWLAAELILWLAMQAL